MTRRLMIAVPLALALAANTFAEWSQFEGPNRDGVAPATNLLTTWPKDGPEVLWTVDLGVGFGGAAVKDGQVFVLDRMGNEADLLRVFDLKKGTELWKYKYTAKGRFSHPGSRSTPAVDANNVYTVSSLGHVNCISRKTHKPIWSLHINEKYDEGRLKWGFAQSPLVHDGKVIVTPVHEESPGLIAIDIADGKVLWESAKHGGDYYASPVIRTIAGETGVLQIFNNHIAFVNPDNGKTIWEYDGYYCKFPIPTPTVLPDGKTLFVTGGYEAGSVMIRVNRNGSKYNIEQLFKMTEGSHLHPVVHHDGYLYANINENKTIRGDNQKLGGFACIDPNSGKVVWRTGSDPHLDRGNFLLVGDKVIMLDGQKGDLYLIDPNPKSFKVLAKAAVLPQEQTRRPNEIWAPLALSDGLLILRDQKKMKCVRVGTPGRL